MKKNFFRKEQHTKHKFYRVKARFRLLVIEHENYCVDLLCLEGQVFLEANPTGCCTSVHNNAFLAP